MQGNLEIIMNVEEWTRVVAKKIYAHLVYHLDDPCFDADDKREIEHVSQIIAAHVPQPTEGQS